MVTLSLRPCRTVGAPGSNIRKCILETCLDKDVVNLREEMRFLRFPRPFKRGGAGHSPSDSGVPEAKRCVASTAVREIAAKGSRKKAWVSKVSSGISARGHGVGKAPRVR